MCMSSRVCTSTSMCARVYLCMSLCACLPDYLSTCQSVCVSVSVCAYGVRLCLCPTCVLYLNMITALSPPTILSSLTTDGTAANSSDIPFWHGAHACLYRGVMHCNTLQHTASPHCNGGESCHGVHACLRLQRHA